MVGIVIVTHGKLGRALSETAEFILNSPLDAVTAVSAEPEDSPESLRKKIAEGIRRVDRKKGVLILTDMFGGAPSDMSYAFLEKGKTDVISSVNLPILLRAVNLRRHTGLSGLGRCLTSYGKQNISLASDILSGKPRSLSSACPFYKGKKLLQAE
ncbi:MAG: PTS fructose transporter subunit IIA [Desulfobacterales bacterium]